MTHNKPTPIPKSVGFAVVQLIQNGNLDDCLPQIAMQIRARQDKIRKDPKGCPNCGGKKGYRRRIHGVPCGRGDFHGGRSW